MGKRSSDHVSLPDAKSRGHPASSSSKSSEPTEGLTSTASSKFFSTPLYGFASSTVSSAVSFVSTPAASTISLGPSFQVNDTPQAALHILQTFLDILLENEVPGPSLFRLHREYTKLLGSGITFQVYGISDECQKWADDGIRNESLRSKVEDYSEFAARLASLKHIAVKRAFVSGSSNISEDGELSAQVSRQEFARQLDSARRETQALCFEPIRNHRNIVRLLGWGLCLDTLEDDGQMEPRVPLLILERAHSSLHDFVQDYDLYSPVSNSTRYAQDLEICLDIGRGLRALHRAQMTHGDLKLENVLLFCIDGKWTAKLSDFGSSIRNDITEEEYRGSYGWEPPKNSLWLESGSSQCCDIFAYGLVLWCVFTRKHCAPMPLQQAARDDKLYGEENLYYTATKEIRSSLTIPYGEIPRILLVLRGSLHGDPMLWERRPWIYLNRRDYPHVSYVAEEPTALMSFTQALNLISEHFKLRIFFYKSSYRFLTSSVAWFCAAASRFSKCYWSIKRRCTRSLAAWLDSLDVSISKLPVNFYLFKATPARRRRELEDTCNQFSDELKLAILPDSLRLFTHSKRAPCYRLHTLLWHFADLNKTQGGASDRTADKLYVLARIRSRFPLCCWQDSITKIPLEFPYHGFAQKPNILDITSGNHLNLSTLAWLCRGEIGRSELETLSGLALWRCVHMRDSRSNISDRLLLLLEHGCRVDRSVMIHGATKSVLRLYLETLNLGHTETESESITLVCGRLGQLATNFGMASSLRFFSCGRGLPDRLGGLETSDNEEYLTTALHECVASSCYAAVVLMLQTGFYADAPDCNGKTALQLAYDIYGSKTLASHVQPKADFTSAALRTKLSLENDRIINLLRQNGQDVRHKKDFDSQPHTASSLPLGWHSIETDLRSVFREKYFGSLTWTKPSFSLFSDQRLAIGFREMRMAGQTYYLDLIRFLDRGTSRASQSSLNAPLLFTEDWYGSEINKVDVSPRKRVYGRERRTGVDAASEQTELLSRPLQGSDKKKLRQSDNMFVRIPALLYVTTLEVFMSNPTNLLLPLVPLSLAAPVYGWSSTSLTGLGLCALIPLCSLLVFAVEELTVRSGSFISSSMVATSLCTVELFVVLFAAQMRQSLLISSLFIGSATCNGPLILGAGFLVDGIRHVESRFNPDPTITAAHVIVLGAIFASLPNLPNILDYASRTGPHEKSVQIITNTIAIISILIYSLYLYVQYKNHLRLHSSDEDGDNEDQDREPQISSRWIALTWAFICVALIAGCSRSLVTGLAAYTPSKQIFIALFAIPIVPRIGRYTQTLFRLSKANSGLALHSMTVSSLNTTICLLLFVYPFLVIVGWIAHWDLSIRFKLVDVMALGLTSWIIPMFLASGRVSYIGGVGLLLAYIGMMIVLAIYATNDHKKI